ncbi:hypothetical protein [Cellvibrio mixtus]|uniref:hypothetical protein n=1 Tax=Cellvibrio mixtus TaxID=39650 RepID=UPI0005879F70|nr:hypothetical protein [Cellvibrio mixtus]
MTILITALHAEIQARCNLLNNDSSLTDIIDAAIAAKKIEMTGLSLNRVVLDAQMQRIVNSLDSASAIEDLIVLAAAQELNPCNALPVGTYTPLPLNSDKLVTLPDGSAWLPSGTLTAAEESPLLSKVPGFVYLPAENSNYYHPNYMHYAEGGGKLFRVGGTTTVVPQYSVDGGETWTNGSVPSWAVNALSVGSILGFYFNGAAFVGVVVGKNSNSYLSVSHFTINPANPGATAVGAVTNFTNSTTRDVNAQYGCHVRVGNVDFIVWPSEQTAAAYTAYRNGANNWVINGNQISAPGLQASIKMHGFVDEAGKAIAAQFFSGGGATLQLTEAGITPLQSGSGGYYNISNGIFLFNNKFYGVGTGLNALYHGLFRWSPTSNNFSLFTKVKNFWKITHMIPQGLAVSATHLVFISPTEAVGIYQLVIMDTDENIIVKKVYFSGSVGPYGAAVIRGNDYIVKTSTGAIVIKNFLSPLPAGSYIGNHVQRNLDTASLTCDFLRIR